MADAPLTGHVPLGDLLAEVLPQGANFTCYHISTPPTKCGPIFSAPPGARPERTYCESHFLNVSVTPDDEQQQSDQKAAGEILVFAIEVLIYTTSHLTTIFVSKADSTGYLSLLQLPRTTSSPIRAISTTFVSWLVTQRQRPTSRLVVSLFARAQDQYLFPGSIENAEKHVADDTALVKWWCRVLDPVLRAYTAEASGTPSTESTAEKAQTTAQGHLLIPGLERNETLRFFPPSVRADPPEQKRWKHGHPLLDISRNPAAPPRCLIPHFPDDPKSRYMDELDDELPDGGNASVTSPSRGTGQWRSVRSLEQFWEMMSFRQECSSGRLVGFIWVVFTPADIGNTLETSDDAEGTAIGPLGRPQPITNSLAEMLAQPPTTPPKKNKSSSTRSSSRTPRRRSSKLTGPIIPRLPRIKSSSSQTSNPDNATTTSASSTTGPSSSSIPESSLYYVWPPHSRGTLVLDEKDYKRATDLLLNHNFAERAIAVVSTRKWIEEVAVLGSRGGTTGWGVAVVGRNASAIAAATATTSADGAQNGSGGGQAVNTLNTSMVRKKRKGGAEGAVQQQQQQQQPAPNAKHDAVAGVNVLSSGLVRKKPKTGDNDAPPATIQPAERPAVATADDESVNVLSSTLIRKKPKA
ncbi:dna damage response protein rtt109 [Diplodia corticola]|uniref:histone acetyltransferase n=1 Tax=Diplodia corticola TaxID=236234 RepID=A0A1J9RX98_9PEZI|nr:dna damage response protein rtt109 [Diplodia corticola]OJD32975.1 dna damage response protein rtt109 [Diplodia corticola]